MSGDGALQLRPWALMGWDHSAMMATEVSMSETRLCALRLRKEPGKHPRTCEDSLNYVTFWSLKLTFIGRFSVYGGF